MVEVPCMSSRLHPTEAGALLSWSHRDKAQPTCRTEGPVHPCGLAQPETDLRAA